MAKLKHFSVPRMKILDTELTIPVAVKSFNIRLIHNTDPVDNNKLFKTIYDEVKNVIETKNFNAVMSRNLRKSIYRHIATLEKSSCSKYETAFSSSCQTSKDYRKTRKCSYNSRECKA